MKRKKGECGPADSRGLVEQEPVELRHSGGGAGAVHRRADGVCDL